MSQAYVTDITVNCQRDNTAFTFIKAFTRFRKLYESENGGIKFKIKAKKLKFETKMIMPAILVTFSWTK